MTTLTTRLSQATEPTRELLEEVWETMHEASLEETLRFAILFSKRDVVRFEAMLDAEAWTSAVEMLLPADTDWTLSVAAYQPCLATIPSGDDRKDAVHGYAATPALALAIACLKARGL